MINYLNVGYLFQKGYELITQGDVSGLWMLLWGAFVSFLNTIAPLSIVASLLLVVGIVYCVVRMRQLHHEQAEMFKLHPPHEAAHGESSENKKWERIASHIQSDKDSDWRLAILEADIMLDDLLESLGYHGDTLSDKLKSVNPNDFKTLDQAWEAHKIRNRIAHEGPHFELTEREAHRVIALYEEVFREFHYI